MLKWFVTALVIGCGLSWTAAVVLAVKQPIYTTVHTSVCLGNGGIFPPPGSPFCDGLWERVDQWHLTPSTYPFIGLIIVGSLLLFSASIITIRQRLA